MVYFVCKYKKINSILFSVSPSRMVSRQTKAQTGESDRRSEDNPFNRNTRPTSLDFHIGKPTRRNSSSPDRHSTDSSADENIYRRPYDPTYDDNSISDNESRYERNSTSH